jgi:hypothetical protein
MRKEYDLKNGRPNPYAKRLGEKGRRELLQLWAKAAEQPPRPTKPKRRPRA